MLILQGAAELRILLAGKRPGWQARRAWQGAGTGEGHEPSGTHHGEGSFSKQEHHLQDIWYRSLHSDNSLNSTGCCMCVAPFDGGLAARSSVHGGLFTDSSTACWHTLATCWRPECGAGGRCGCRTDAACASTPKVAAQRRRAGRRTGTWRRRRWQCLAHLGAARTLRSGLLTTAWHRYTGKGSSTAVISSPACLALEHATRQFPRPQGVSHFVNSIKVPPPRFTATTKAKGRGRALAHRPRPERFPRLERLVPRSQTAPESTEAKIQSCARAACAIGRAI